MMWKIILVVMMLLCSVGCEQEVRYETEYIYTKEIGKAYIYFCKSYQGCLRKWHWISIVEGEEYLNEQAIILSKNEKQTTLKFYTSPAPGGRIVTINVPNKLIYIYDKTKHMNKIENYTKNINKELEKYFIENSPTFELDMRKVNQYGGEVDMCFGVKERGK